MTDHQRSVSTRSFTRLIGLSILAVLILCNGLPPSAHSASTKQVVERIDKGEFYYNGGKEVPLVRHRGLFAVKFNESGPAQNEKSLALKSVLNRNKGLIRYSSKSKFFERHQISLLESIGEGNGERHEHTIKRLNGDPDVKYVQPVFIIGADEPLVMSDCFVARFDGNLSMGEIDAINAQNGVEIVKSIAVDSNVFVLRVVVLKDRTTLDVANKYYNMDVVEWSHPDWIRRLELRHTPNDPLYPDQWHLNNTGAGGGSADADIDAPEAWDLTKGDAGITVAVIDDGVDTGHEDFAGKIVPGRDVVNDNDNPDPQTGDNHGTAVAGLSAANQDNGTGVTGSAPNCKIMPIRLLDWGAVTSDEAEAFLFATQNGADIITNSWGPPDGTGTYFPLPDVTKAAIDFATESGRDGKGCVILFAAGNGNESMDNDGYASYEKVIAVGASTDSDARAYYSDYGSSLDIMSPSSGGFQGITTTDLMGLKGYNSGNYTSNFGGTSAATPIAAGVAALMLSVNGDLTRGEVQAILESTADKINPSEADYGVNGFSEKYGHGRINAYNAVLEAMDPNFPPVATITSPSDGVTITVDESVNFTGDVVDKENAIVSYHWDFDGGAPDSFVEDPGPVIFSTPGTFNVTFTVTDDGGKQSSDSVKIIVIDTGDEVVTYMVDSSGTPIDLPDFELPDVIGSMLSTALAYIGNYILEVNVLVDITHTYIGDLRISIESPEGTVVTLHERSGGNSDDLVTTYDTLTAPAENLDAFIGENPQGLWTLHVEDHALLDVGILNKWQLEIVAINGSVPEKPDLVVTKVNKVKIKRAKSKVRARVFVENQGMACSDDFDVEFFLSSDNVLDNDDVSITTIAMDALGPKKKKKKKLWIDIPPTVTNGKYHVIAEVDPQNLIDELLETNNSKASRRTIRIR